MHVPGTFGHQIDKCFLSDSQSKNLDGRIASTAWCFPLMRAVSQPLGLGRGEGEWVTWSDLPPGEQSGQGTQPGWAELESLTGFIVCCSCILYCRRSCNCFSASAAWRSCCCRRRPAPHPPCRPPSCSPPSSSPCSCSSPASCSWWASTPSGDCFSFPGKESSPEELSNKFGH